ncbi:hypothetical protein [Luteimonas sp. R10]|uniref:hypothetical protein n=1 Tax=Luteimonas sp. R10 TaxID=3108176 RepID=UPI0030933CD2|nr:hypothetical protein U3649_17980 [Luteimonas sp. R10]
MTTSVQVEPYRFGFLVVPAGSEPADVVPAHWNRHLFDGVVAFSHPDVPARKYEGACGSAWILGDIHLSRGGESVDDLLERVLGGRLEALDGLSGRFVVLASHSNGECRLYHDPFGSRSVYYRADGRIGAGSHPALVAAAFGDAIDPDAVAFRDSPEYRQRGTSYLPGDRSMYRDIVALVPNHYLDLRRCRSVRYWPREGVGATELAAFFGMCDEYFSHLAGFLRERYRTVLGLTGGVDSRALIAGLRACGVDGRFLTWGGGRLPSEERPAVERMIDHLKAPHAFVDVGRGTAWGRDPALRAATDAATGYSRGPSALTANMSAVVGSGDVFLRGYGGEILRGFYNRHNLELPERTPEALARLYLTRRVPNPSRSFHRFVIRSFELYIERTEFEVDFHDVDALDVFYWEQRMGVWGATMLCEMDPVVRSMAGFNSRALFAAAFGLQRKERIGSELLLGLTRRYDPTLADIGSVS